MASRQTGEWSMRCPQGHASIKHHTETYSCVSCRATYEGEPYDARDVEFPVDDDPLEKVNPDDVLEIIISLCEQPTKTTVKASQLPMGRVGQRVWALRELRDDGFLEMCGNENHGHAWKPTLAGVRRVRGEADE